MSALFLLFAATAIAALQFADFRRLASWRTIGALAIVTLAVIVAARALVPSPDTFATTRLAQRAEAAAKVFSSLQPGTSAIIAVGASRSHFGLRRKKLEQELSKPGRPVALIKLTVAGADNFQRLELLRRFSKRVSEFGMPNLNRFVVLFEVQENYDTMPLTFWRALKQTWSPEAMETTQPHNAGLLIRSFLSSQQIRDPGLFAQLIAHLSSNALGLGALAPLSTGSKPRSIPTTLVEPPVLTKQPPRNAKKIKSRLRNFELRLGRIEAKEAKPFDGWKLNLVEPLFAEALPTKPDAIAYYNVPSIKPADYRHARRWCAAIKPAACFYFGMAQWSDNADYSDNRNWRDPGHMMAPLTDVWTEFIAKSILDAGLLGSEGGR
ncbi:MAG: hypothetical protein K0U74_00740 [Alphaproteobacteria bacterium]|nr:hypothetical protein [Alphaproteobacteria bacterium]